ncbi:unnamed protein product [Caretta caretta]
MRGWEACEDIGSERYTFSFTIRDSPAYFINVNSWGREEYVRSLSESFRVGDCVTIENPLVQTKELEKEEKFNPTTPSCYKLLLSETHSVVKICCCYEVDTKLLSLLHLPVKDPHDYYSLGDIVANGQSLDGRIINVLAAVKSVGEPKYFTTSDKRKGQRCEVKLYDETELSFAMIWNCMTATVISKTIFTTNPDTPEANILFNFIKESAATGALDDITEAQLKESINLQTIVDIYTVEQLKVKALQNEGKPEPVYGIIYAYISTLNIDTDSSKIIRNRCSGCHYVVNEMSNTCTFCSDISSDAKSVFTSFDLLVDLTDHTGTLRSCYLSDVVAEETLSCTVHEFLTLTEEQKTALKWHLLLERSKIYFKRLQFYHWVSAFLGTLDSHECLVLGGDFNTTLKEQDRSGTEQSPAAADTLREIVEHHSLVDIWRDHHPDDTSTFTFVRVEAHRSSHSPLDCIYLSRFHLSRAHSSSIRLAPFSDRHLATVTASLYAERPGPAYWHFNSSLLEDEGFVTSFQEFWLAWRGQRHAFPLAQRWWDLGKVRARLFCRDYTWGTGRWRNAAIEQLEQEVLELERRLAAIPKDPLLCRACQEKQEELWALEDHRARGTFVRSHICLLREMDHGSRFFYALEKTRGPRNTSPASWQKTAPPSRNQWRCAGGPEPSTQVFSPRIRPTLAFAECSGRSSLRRAVLALLPKKGDLRDLRNWRPISLLSTDYKIVTKAISLWLGSVLADVIHPDQTYTVPDCSIFDNLFLVWDHLELGCRDGLSFALLSLDQEKAFDRVDHGYLLNTLQAFGFRPLFVGFLRVLYASAERLVKLNWTLTEPVSFGREVRQGCPFSGQLYTLAIKPFLCLLRRRLTGLVLQEPELRLVLSAYADDMLLVVQDLGDLAWVEACQAIYSAASSARVNWVKSSGLAVVDWRQASSLPPTLQTIWVSSKEHKHHRITRLTKLLMYEIIPV